MSDCPSSKDNENLFYIALKRIGLEGRYGLRGRDRPASRDGLRNRDRSASRNGLRSRHGLEGRYGLRGRYRPASRNRFWAEITKRVRTTQNI